MISVSQEYLKNIIIFALNSGFRKNEILTLTWDCINFNDGTLRVKSENSKHKKTRTIPMNNNLRSLLNQLRMFSRISDFVFLSSKGHNYKRQDSLNRAFNLALKKANIEGVNFHTLRHTFGTRVYQNSKDLVAVSKLLGHSSIELTKSRYVHNDASLIDAINTLDNNILVKSVTKSVSKE